MGDWLDDEDVEAWPVADDEPATAVDCAQPMDLEPVEELSTDAEVRKEQAREAWKRLSDRQKLFIHRLRANRFNFARAIAVSHGKKDTVAKSTVSFWKHQPDFAMCVEYQRSKEVKLMLAPDRLIARQDDIVENLLEAKPILYQGQPTGFFENEAAAAGKANEVLLKVAGVLTNDDSASRTTAGPAFHISIVQSDKTVIDVTPRYVEVALPAPGPLLDSVVAEQ